ncbi:MAG: protein kinase [Planctomycetota bacterium]
MSLFLKILKGPGTGQVLPIPIGQPVTLGRSASASYAFDDPLLSRKHCAVETRGELCRIVDLQSRNGTYVNGQRIGAVLLQTGDRVKIGNMIFEVSPVAAATSAEQQISFQGGRPTADLPPAANVPTNLIDGFEILEQREVTSFGVTYLARQVLMDRTVLLKTIELGPDTDEKALRRFKREAKTGGRLTHPHIVELYDVNEQDGLLYIVTEYVDGRNLGQVLEERKGQPLAAKITLTVLSHVADALAYAHEQQIVHRDVRPHNILIRNGDHAGKLQGFTLAKNLARAGLSVITADGESLGTPYYMPPEQVRSAKTADERSDIYSWAATTYHCLSGRLPLEARSYGEFIDKVFNQDPPALKTVVPSCPAPLNDLLVRCMKRSPDERPANMGAVLDALEPVVRALG